MKIAYVITWPIANNDGITRKFWQQTAVWQKLGHEVTVYVLDVSSTKTEPLPFVRQYFRGSSQNPLQQARRNHQLGTELVADVKKSQPDIIYLRHQFYKKSLLGLFDIAPVFIELNGDDSKMPIIEGITDLRNIALRGYNLATRSIYLSKATGYIGVTAEQQNLPAFKSFQKPFFVAHNGIRLCDCELLPPPHNEIPRLALIYSSPKYRYHGWEKIRLLANASIGRLNIDLIGPPPEMTMPANVTCHGYCQPEAYRTILRSVDVGLGPLDFHIDGAVSATPLKTRECLGMGIPMVIGYRDDALHTHRFEWLLQLPSTADNVSAHLNEIIAFCHAMKGKRVPRQEVAPLIDLDVIEARKLDILAKYCHRTEVSS